MIEYIFCLLFFESAFAFLNYDIEQNQTIGNWDLGPQIKSVIPLEPPGFMIIFTGVRTPSVDDPVIWYKLTVKEITTVPLDQDTVKRDKIEHIDNLIDVLQRKVDLAHLFTTVYKGSPFEINIPVIHREYMYRVRVVHVQQKVQYAITVQAYTKALEGPVSKPARGYIDGRGHTFVKHSSKHSYYPIL